MRQRMVGVSAALVFALLLSFADARAQGAADAAASGPRFLLASASKLVPLDVDRTPVLARRLALNLEGITLKQALAEIAARAGLELAYSDDIVASTRRVHLQAGDITAAAALTDVLLGAGVDVVFGRGGRAWLVRRTALVAAAPGTIVGRVTDAKSQTALAGATVVVQGTSHSATTGSDGRYRIAEVAPGTYAVRARYIGYAPGTVSVTVSTDEEATADLALEKSAQRLDEVVTTGTVVPTEVKALPTPISVITADDIQRQNLQRIDQVFRGQVPGAIAWDQSPGYDYYSDIAVRGASSLSSTIHSVKTVVDGVELADGFDIATIDPNSIDRVEIIRGPQASTLYGAGALNGVMQIFTKKGSLGLTRPEVTAKVSAGSVAGFDGRSSTLQTDNTVSVRGGGEKTGYNVGGSYRHVGEWVPSYYSRNWGVSAGAQTTQGPFTFSSFARYADQTFAPPWDTRFQSYTYYSQPFYNTNRLRQQTYGVTASVSATRNWQHTLTVGYDQSYYNWEQTQGRFTMPADSFRSAYSQHEAQTSLLYRTDLTLRLGSAAEALVTAGVHYNAYEATNSYTFGATRTTGNLDGVTSAYDAPWNNTGYFSQVQLGFADRLFITGGLRAERDPNFGATYAAAWSPRVGMAYVLGLGPARVKLRASYGESIRAPAVGLRDANVTPYFVQLANPALAPERQRGGDGGVDVYIGRASLGVTYYNQRAIDLIQEVDSPMVPGTLFTFQWQNLDRVKNEGWEFEAQVPLGAVQLSATYSVTNSTVQQLPVSYTGDYQLGDQILAVPHKSAGATVTYSPLPQTRLTASMTYLGHWTNVDYVTLYGFFYGGQPYRGSNRAYWMEYPTVTKFAVGISQALTKGVTAFARAENIGNTLRFERENSTIPMPRSVFVGANLRY